MMHLLLFLIVLSTKDTYLGLYIGCSYCYYILCFSMKFIFSYHHIVSFMVHVITMLYFSSNNYYCITWISISYYLWYTSFLSTSSTSNYSIVILEEDFSMCYFFLHQRQDICSQTCAEYYYNFSFNNWLCSTFLSITLPHFCCLWWQCHSILQIIPLFQRTFTSFKLIYPFVVVVVSNETSILFWFLYGTTYWSPHPKMIFNLEKLQITRYYSLLLIFFLLWNYFFVMESLFNFSYLPFLILWILKFLVVIFKTLVQMFLRFFAFLIFILTGDTENIQDIFISKINNSEKIQDKKSIMSFRRLLLQWK